MDRGAAVLGTERGVRSVGPPTFDLHQVEEALLINHRLFNGRPMTRAEVEMAVEQYRGFLRDHKATGMPEKFSVPSRVIDRVWHTHMCETKQYAQDCHEYFGQMFHHASILCDGGVMEQDRKS